MRHPLAAVLLLFSTAACAPAGTEPASDGRALAGGWSPAALTPEIEEIAAWAIDQADVPGARLAGIENVERQVVAGTNYRMDLVLADGRRWRVQVYRRLDGTRTLTSAAEVSAE